MKTLILVTLLLSTQAFALEMDQADRAESRICEKLLSQATKTCYRDIEQADDLYSAVQNCIDEEMQYLLSTHNSTSNALDITCGLNK